MPGVNYVGARLPNCRRAPDPTSSEPLQEALSVDTSPERLQELFQVDPTLGPVIASNPSTSLQLLDQLALHFPVEVLATNQLSTRIYPCGLLFASVSPVMGSGILAFQM